MLIQLVLTSHGNSNFWLILPITQVLRYKIKTASSIKQFSLNLNWNFVLGNSYKLEVRDNINECGTTSIEFQVTYLKYLPLVFNIFSGRNSNVGVQCFANEGKHFDHL